MKKERDLKKRKGLLSVLSLVTGENSISISLNLVSDVSQFLSGSLYIDDVFH